MLSANRERYGLWGPAALQAKALRIALAYAVFALAWIYLSDHALLALVSEPEFLVRWSTAKGVAFVAITTVLLLLLIKRAFRAIDGERRFAREMIESMPGIVYFYDDQGRFLRWNRNFAKVSGYSNREIAAMHPLDFFAGPDKAIMKARIAAVFETGEARGEARFVARNGSTTPYLFTGRRIVHDGSTWLVGVGVDISEHMRYEAALKEANETLERSVAERTRELQEAVVRAESADRLKSAFLATMSHELRTPLNSIIGFTGIVLKGMAGELNAEQSKQLGMVQGSARHLLELINDVLDLTRIDAGELEVRSEPFDLRASAERVVASVRPLAARKGLDLALELPNGLGEVIGDCRRIEQILLNLLNNGIKFTERGGVTLAVERAEAEGPALRFRVTDTGIGVKREDLSSLFLPFRQIDSGLSRRHEGTGLGLSICRRLADLMGGEIHVESEWGKGSRFTVVLPMRAGSRS